jgi:histidinol-phosphate phosphatase family protein
VRFVGIDLAWSPRNLSGGVILAAGGELEATTASLGDDDEIVDFVTSAVPADCPGLVAIDAPLAVPNETGGRPCDAQVASIYGRFEAAPYQANRRTLRKYGGLRGEALRVRLERLGFRHDPWILRRTPTRQLVEVFPHPATVSLLHLERTLKYKARQGRGYELRWHELARLREGLVSLARAEPALHLPERLRSMPIKGLRGRAFKEVEDGLDAIVCAYGAAHAWFHGPRGYALYGNAAEGHILVPMTAQMWQRIKRPQILFLDRDGTLNRSLGHRPPNHPDEVEILAGVAEALHHHASLGWYLVVVTNQGGVAFGYQTESQAEATHQAVLDALPVEIDVSYLCPHHPRGTIARYARECPNRKPAPGRIVEALERFGAKPEACLFVGDLDTDQQAAEAAGVPFRWAWEFFERSPLAG